MVAERIGGQWFMRIYILRYKSLLVARGDEIPHELTLSLRRYQAIKCLSTRTSSVVMVIILATG
jgi:hypothetical protein